MLNKTATVNDYHIFRIPKPRKPGKQVKYRTIHAPNAELKAAQEEVLQKLYHAQNLGASPSAFAYVKGRSLLALGKRHLDQPFALKLDIKDFFPSITVRHVRRCLLGRDVLLDVQNLCFIPDGGGLPQGAPTSAFLSNLALKEFDMRLNVSLSNLPRKPIFSANRYSHRDRRFKRTDKANPAFGSAPITYSRYADDLLLTSTDATVHNQAWRVRTILNKATNLKLNTRKTRRVGFGGRIHFCGMTISDRVNAHSSYRKHVRNLAHRCIRDVVMGRCEPGFYIDNGNIVPVDILGLLGQLSFIRQLNPHLSLNKLSQILMEVHGTPREQWSYNTNNYLQPEKPAYV